MMITDYLTIDYMNNGKLLIAIMSIFLIFRALQYKKNVK